MKLRYNINEQGLVTAIGYVSNYDIEVINEPFGLFDYFNYRKDLVTGEWISTLPNYSYFILPLDIVSQIKHYSAWVKEAYPEKIFDVVLNTEEIEVEGQMVTVPTNIIKMIPCGITAFNAEGEMLLEAVIESWNTQGPGKAINFNVKFYSLSELTQFIESCTNSR